MKEGIIIGVLVVILVALFVLNAFRRKKFNQEMNQMRTDLKIGDKVMTDSGIVGEISEIYEQDGYKYFVLRSGGAINYGYFSVHANAVYYAFGKEKENEKTIAEEKKEEAKPEEKVVEVETQVVESKSDEAPKKTKKSKLIRKR